MSVFDAADGVASEATWRCPRCRTVQARTNRCWRCSQPAHTCETCHRYQPSVAAALGTCARDPVGPLVAATESRSCWEPDVASGTDDPVTAPDGLFTESGLLPEPTFPPGLVQSAPPIRPVPERPTRTPVVAVPSSVKPRLEQPGRAAWAEPAEDRLVEAPAVEPGKRLTTEVQRRRRRWFR